jgi:hypothetical protein
LTEFLLDETVRPALVNRLDRSEAAGQPDILMCGYDRGPQEIKVISSLLCSAYLSGGCAWTLQWNLLCQQAIGIWKSSFAIHRRIPFS